WRQPDLSEKTYLVTGGLGGLGLLTARWLADQGAKHLALLSRRSLETLAPTRQQAIEDLRDRGIEVKVIQADVCQYSDVVAALSELEASLPVLGGVIHAAGVLDDGVLQNLSWKRLATVLAPKVWGAWHLHQLTLNQPLDFFVLFSSAASLLGSPGQGSHVAANSYLDTLAHYRRGLGLPALSINWGAWASVGAAADRQVDQHLQTQGIGTIAPDQGLDVLDYLLNRSDLTQVGVVPIQWEQFCQDGAVQTRDPLFANFANLVSQARARVSVSQDSTQWLSRLAKLPERQRLSELNRQIQQEVSQVLGLPPTRSLDPQQQFFDLGMDSLMAVELKNRLETKLSRSIPSTILFEYPTIAALTKHLKQLAFDRDAQPQAAAASGEFVEPPESAAVPDPLADWLDLPPNASVAANAQESDNPDVAAELAALERLLNPH
ncbi:MAG: SDR family NAD(P)-dependent oxidoreductase, partial [Cyanobacteria bacterium P01_H01_bin.121]